MLVPVFSPPVVDPFGVLLDCGRDLMFADSLEKIVDIAKTGMLALEDTGKFVFVVGDDDFNDMQVNSHAVSERLAATVFPSSLAVASLADSDSVLHDQGWTAFSVEGPAGERAAVLVEGLCPSVQKTAERFVRQVEAAWDGLGKYAMLEEMVATEMTAVVQREESIQLILDSMTSGLLVCRLDGTLTEIRSRVVTDWFGDAADAKLWSFLLPDNEQLAMTMEVGFEQLVEDFLPFDVAAGQIVQRFPHGEKTFGLAFDPIREDNVLGGIVVKICDLTSVVAAEAAEQKSRELASVVRVLLQDESAFQMTISDLDRRLRLLTVVPREDALRELHTLKGTSATLGLERFSRACHKAESEIDDDPSSFDAAIPEVKTAWQQSRDVFESFAGESHRIRVSRHSLEAVIQLLSVGSCAEAIAVVETWSRPSMETVFRQMEKNLIEAGAAIGKKVRVVPLHRNLHVPSQKAEQFMTALTHVGRNAVAHGIETEADRLVAGKNETGTITLSCRNTFDSAGFEIEINDDGAGIDWEHIRILATERGLPSETEPDLVAVLVSDGVSTSRDADQLSGRGVGMPAVVTALLELDGTFSVHSEIGIGTTWSFQFLP